MSGMGELTPDMVRLLVDGEVDDQASAALVEWYANLARGIAEFPESKLRTVEPPLRSTPGPTE
jgi:hypothetical protein